MAGLGENFSEERVFAPLFKVEKSHRPLIFPEISLRPLIFPEKNSSLPNFSSEITLLSSKTSLYENQCMYSFHVSYANEHTRVNWPTFDLKNAFFENLEIQNIVEKNSSNAYFFQKSLCPPFFSNKISSNLSKIDMNLKELEQYWNIFLKVSTSYLKFLKLGVIPKWNCWYNRNIGNWHPLLLRSGE